MKGLPPTTTDNINNEEDDELMELEKRVKDVKLPDYALKVVLKELKVSLCDIIYLITSVAKVLKCILME